MATTPVRNFNLVVPLAQKATAMRIADTGGLDTRARSGAVSTLIGASLRRGDVDSTNGNSTPLTLTMPGIRTSTTATRTTTTRTTTTERVPSADGFERHHADFSLRLKHVVSVSGGKDSTATLLLALENCPRESIVPIFCDTGNEHQAVHDYLAYLEQALDITIHRLKADFSKQIASKRMFVARDMRHRRKYDTEPVFDADGNPVPKRDGRGNIVMRKVKRDGLLVEESIQKTKKVGGGHRVRWSNKAKRRALAALHPSGNPFLDLCMWKGRFPSRKAQFCTEELKINMAVEFQLDLIDEGYQVLSWQGVRRDESQARKDAKKIERLNPKMWAFRPLVEWAAMQVFDYCASRGIQPNPLYKQGMSRVGCMPCINVNKEELRQIAQRFPDAIEEKAEWERKVALCSKRMAATFIPAPGMSNHEAAKQTIWTVVEWSKTTRGGRQFNLLAELDEPTACASAYGLCE